MTPQLDMDRWTGKKPKIYNAIIQEKCNKQYLSFTRYFSFHTVNYVK